MKLRLLAVGQKMPAWVDAGYTEYARRLPPHLKLRLEELRPGNRHRGAAAAMAEENEAILARAAGTHLVALDGGGKPWTTEKLAQRLEAWMAGGQDVCLAVGGPDGHGQEVLANAAERWSLGPLTLPHPLVRVVLAEQLYRAWTILEGHPYHRG